VDRAAVDELHAQGAAAWPDVRVDIERFAAEVERRLGDNGATEDVRSLHADVYLVIAAADGDETAAGHCDRIAEREVMFASTKLRASVAATEDIRSELRRLLFTSDGDRPAAITTFSGRGDLRGYARVIAARALARRMQKERRETEASDALVDAISPLDPEVALLRERYRTDVDAAFRAALATLTDRARAVLRYHQLDGWSIDQIGERYGVHRSTAARWVTAAHAELGAGIRAQLATRLAIPESQVDSIVALVTSAVEVSLDRLLATR
jgi:RNA polymerase sigma-70 factor (ECF subfamily)